MVINGEHHPQSARIPSNASITPFSRGVAAAAEAYLFCCHHRSATRFSSAYCSARGRLFRDLEILPDEPSRTRRAGR